MLASRSKGLTLAAGLAVAITLAMAWPVIASLSTQVYGREIIGRHPDVHAAIAAFGQEPSRELASQPITSVPGWLLSRAINPVAAFNLIVLLSFPLSAVTAYLLARYLHGSHTAAVVAGLIFAFSPAHLAQAAYHPYTTQIQWIPLYFLALIAVVTRGSARRVLGLVGAAAALVLANYDAAVICALLAPVVVVGFWAIRDDATRNFTPLIWLGALLIGLVAALAVTLVVRPGAFSLDSAGGLPIQDIALFRARWWAYFLPAVDHPILGDAARGTFGRHWINVELVEQQVFIGYAFLGLALIAFGYAAWTWRAEWRYLVPMTGIGLAAAVISVGPTSGSCLPFSLAPACLVFHVVPVFRAYARFAVAVNLAVAIAAGAGVVILTRHSVVGRIIAVALLTVGVFEFWPLPARAHDVLPTTGHRWVVEHPEPGRVLDCYPPTQNNRFLPWLMNRSLTFLDETIPTCADPELGQKLTALGYTQVIVRGGEASSKLVSPLPPGISVAEQLPDAAVYAVATSLPPVLTVAARGFYDYEHDAEAWWRWMGPEAQWTVRNTTSTPRRTSLVVELVPIGAPRTLTVTVDGAAADRVSLDMEPKAYTLGPYTFTPGDHIVGFAADGEPMRPSDVADSKDTRLLTVSFRNERWEGR